MAFDSPTRGRLAKLVSDVRTTLTAEFEEQCQQLFGISASGTQRPLEDLGHLDDAERSTAALLRERISYLALNRPNGDAADAVTQLLREQAFTVLNRLAALRMAEKRGLIVEAVGKGYRSKGFKVFETVARTGLGDAYLRYRQYLSRLFDELALDLGVLFDRRSPQGMLFPREPALLRCLELLNAADVDGLWAEDETIGWVYQYYNDPAERKRMRDESSAPRNSRELAVRNQFFTPRYVVEFLTDNTLGRIWYEATKGQTRLRQRCRYLFRRANEKFLNRGEAAPTQPRQDAAADGEMLEQLECIPHRPLKDPRTILMLDPACGSMHFGLYAFDLFEEIYEEAWEIEEALGSDALVRPAEMRSLHDTYGAKYAFLKDVPRLIVQHNIHGIDIDPRCAQIAGLSLWLRAQKTWKQTGLTPAERPTIDRSNIVCAEPMPGDKGLLREFVEREFPVPERSFFLRLMEGIFDQMQLAGEAGSLLRIEEDIRGAIADAKNLWKEAPALQQSKLFAELEVIRQGTLAFDLSGITDEQFWDTAESRIYAALRDYAEQAEAGGGFRRRLFAEDAARGFAFIDVCRKRYDISVMNPPFGLSTSEVFESLKKQYQDTYVELYGCFVARGLQITPGGFVGAITSRAFLMTKKLARWRYNQLVPSIDVILDLGIGVMDNAFVEAAAYAMRSPSCFSTIVAANRRHESTKDQPLQLDGGEVVFQVPRTEILSLPGHKLLYQLPVEVFALLKDKSIFEPRIGTARDGMRTFDDFRFVRLRWEVPSSAIGADETWEPLAKGGEHAKYYSDLHLLVKWCRDGKELSEVNIQVNGQVAQSRQASNYYRRQGATYSKRSAKGFSARALPSGCIIGTKGPAVLSDSDVEPAYLVGWLNASLVVKLIHIQANAYEFNTGIIKNLPWRYPANPDQLAALTKRTIEKVRELKTLEETNSLFVLTVGESLGMMASRRETLRSDVSQAIGDCESVWDAAVESLYGCGAWESDELADEPEELSGDESEDEEQADAELRVVSARAAMSQVLGHAFGRWDIRYATGEQVAPELPDPFAPLPACPPSQLQNTQGLPAGPEDVPAAYPVRIPWGGILVDDPNHPLDIERRVREVIEIIWRGHGGGPTAEAIEQEACEILGVKSLRDYFRKPAEFFSDHLRRYSKSRRQAPVYWPLSTSSGRYTLWVYYHRLTDQTLHTALADFVDPKIRDTERGLAEARTAGRQKEVEDRAALLDELREFRADIEGVIRLPWKPNLNDGVMITASPLWRLFRLPKWQKDVKACWQKLQNGDYDWAHLALDIWPDRVKAACAADKSIAIAHGLEHLYAEPAKDSKAHRGNRGRRVGTSL